MSAIIGEDQLKDTIGEFKDKDPDVEFYGGMIYKQNENKSLYHYGNTSGVTIVIEGGQGDQWPQVRLIRDKCINLYKKYTNKFQ